MDNNMFVDLANIQKGYQDAWDGVPHESGKGEVYDKWYSIGMQEQANLDAISSNQDEGC